MEALLIKSLIISLVCVGLRMVSSKGMIFYFLRWPYDRLQKHLKKEKKFLKFLKKATTVPKIPVTTTEKIILFYKTLIYILKPFIGCVTCMASVYSLAIDWHYYGHCDRYKVLLIFMVACLNTLFYTLFEKLNK